MRYVFEQHPVSISYTASAAINLELSPKPYTITELDLWVNTDITTTTATNFNDYWDRIIANLSLSGRGKTYFNYSDMRSAYFHEVFQRVAYRRPTVVADSQTNNDQWFGYKIHFGVQPWKIRPDGNLARNHYDLTSGIPPAEVGNLTLGGTWGTATAAGTNVTVNGSGLTLAYVQLRGVMPESGDPPGAHLPQSIPVWSMRTITPTATSSLFATQDSVPAGDFLKNILVKTTNGTNAPRASDVLGSVEVYNQLESREIWRADQYRIAEMAGQDGGVWLPASDDATTLGVPSILPMHLPGLLWVDLGELAIRAGSNPLFGLDLRNVGTGDLQLRYGVADATGITMDVLYQKYQML